MKPKGLVDMGDRSIQAGCGVQVMDQLRRSSGRLWASSMHGITVAPCSPTGVHSVRAPGARRFPLVIAEMPPRLCTSVISSVRRASSCSWGWVVLRLIDHLHACRRSHYCLRCSHAFRGGLPKGAIHGVPSWHVLGLGLIDPASFSCCRWLLLRYVFGARAPGPSRTRRPTCE